MSHWSLEYKLSHKPTVIWLCSAFCELNGVKLDPTEHSLSYMTLFIFFWFLVLCAAMLGLLPLDFLDNFSVPDSAFCENFKCGIYDCFNWDIIVNGFLHNEYKRRRVIQWWSLLIQHILIYLHSFQKTARKIWRITW